MRLQRAAQVDQPVRGGEAGILRDLEWLGIGWDEGPVRQSERFDEYRAAASGAEGVEIRDGACWLRARGLAPFVILRGDGRATYNWASAVDDLRDAHAAGASVARIATHCTEADVSAQHFGAARDLGMETVGFLMLSHRLDPAGLAKQARIMVDAGAECVYVVDSAGALVLSDAQARVQALLSEIGSQAQVGFHGHQNLSMGVANSVLAVQGGARQVDGALCALGAGAGNAPTEVLAATFSRLGIGTGVDVDGVLAAAEEVVRPIIPRLPWMDRASVVQGYAGVYSSFLLHAQRAAERYGVPAHAILQRVGEAGYVGGQEDMIIDIALQLQAESAEVTSPAGAER